ncbi:MAG TPA: hypothetical protein VNZ93_14815 [Pseudorhodoplanes sp.]|nr:hypothetical protein [Pseudorhodoplanes sp.]
MVGLYVSLVGSNNYAMDAPAIQAFGTITSPATRANMMRAAAESLFHHLGMQLGLEPAQETIDEADSLEAELIDVLNCYAGWMGRRNDVAHGCVGSVGEDPPTYRLLPSIASAKKWCHVISEPAFTFVAKDLDGFTRGFDELAARTSDLAERILEFRQETARLIATE